MTAPLSDARLAEIDRRHRYACTPVDYRMLALLDIPALLTEVQRLRAALAQAREPREEPTDA